MRADVCRTLQGVSMGAIALLLAGCGGPSGTLAKATVVTIDRECEIIESTRREVDDPRGSGVKLDAQEMRTLTGDCKSVPEWEQVRKSRTRDVQGKAAIHVEYQLPSDGSVHTGTLNFTGRDDLFYKLDAGDTVDILISADDPKRIRAA